MKKDKQGRTYCKKCGYRYYVRLRSNKCPHNPMKSFLQQKRGRKKKQSVYDVWKKALIGLETTRDKTIDNWLFKAFLKSSGDR